MKQLLKPAICWGLLVLYLVNLVTSINRNIHLTLTYDKKLKKRGEHKLQIDKIPE